MKGRVVTLLRRCVGAVAAALCLLAATLPGLAGASGMDSGVAQAEADLEAARARAAALTTAVDQAVQQFERAQAHHTRLLDELARVERDVAAARDSQAQARAQLSRRVAAAYRAPYTDLALATAVLDAPDAATAIHRARLMSRLTVRGAHEVTGMRAAEARAQDGLRQRRVIAAGTAAAAAQERLRAQELTELLAEAGRQAEQAEQRVRRARQAAAALVRGGAAASVPVDGKVCPVAGANGFIDSWGFPRSGGRTHKGVDMFAEHGTALVAVADGLVRRVYHNRLGGLSIDLLDEHGDRYYYAHLSSAAVASGERVRAGDVIGAVGTSGNARGTPPHLHWQVHPGDGGPVNPFPLARALCR